MAIAEGEVRCGVCFKVFNATKEGLTCSEGDSPEQPIKTSKSVASDKVKELNLTDAKPASTATQLPDQSAIKKLTIEEESVEDLLAHRPSSRKMQQPFLWGSLSLTAVTILFMQWLWFNQDVYANHPKWHSWYQQACQYLHCSANEYQALHLIETERLSIQSHPDFSNVLKIDLIIRNQALFPQVLPAIDVTFYDINEAIVAARTFHPNEYVGGQRSPQSMPVGIPFHLSFSIFDPGTDAVNYGLKFSPSF